MTTNKDIEIVRAFINGAYASWIRVYGVKTDTPELESLTRIESALAEREWQPISTAPRDGTLIDVWLSGKDGGFRKAVRWMRIHDDFMFVTAGGCFYWDGYTPTHWMPHPQPPKGEKE